MAEPLRHSYEQDAESATIAPLPPALPGTPPAEIHEGPFVVEEREPSTTERVGSAVGEAFGNLRSRVRSGIQVVAGRSREAGDSLGDMTETAQERAREWSRDAGVRFDQFRRNAYRRIHQARVTTQRTVHEHPLESILAIGGLAVVIGFVLRVWRDNRD